LTLAITDVVQRWWTDDTARFPQRMPLPKEEEKLLQASCLLHMLCPFGCTNEVVSGWKSKFPTACPNSVTFWDHGDRTS
jgi:hypothetical protein